MDNCFLYSEILEKIGWFDCQQSFKRLDKNVNFVHFINQPITIDCNTLIAYFPGCFAHFHDGHITVIEQMKKLLQSITDNYVIVIAPANSDYTVNKYGQDNVYASNKYRYDRIVEVLDGYEGNIAIDLNCMLNNDRDYNFPDLLKDFVERHISSFDDLTHIPYVMCGKDRQYFKTLELLTNKIRIFYGDDTTQLSSSQFIKQNPKTFNLKTCYLRCNNPRQYYAFIDFFGHNYKSVIPIFLREELRVAEMSAKFADVTICKEYAHLLPYIPFHRQFSHPLITKNGFVGDIGQLAGKLVLDSDSFTGGTARAISNMGGTLKPIFRFNDRTASCELVDFNDFYDDNYCYPHYDIAERCSMLPFTKYDHENLRQFKLFIKSINQEIL